MNLYDGKMDAECIPLCDAINSIPGLETTSSCCGHGEVPFSIHFTVHSLDELPILLYYIDPCHVGFRWDCKVRTDCAMQPASFYIESHSTGQDSYEEARIIAEKVNEYLASALSGAS